MYHDGNPAIIEPADIATAYYAAPDPVITLADGRQALLVALVLAPERGKRYGPGEAPHTLYLTDGIHHQSVRLTALPVADASPDEPDEPDEPEELVGEAEMGEEAESVAPLASNVSRRATRGRHAAVTAETSEESADADEAPGESDEDAEAPFAEPGAGEDA